MTSALYWNILQLFNHCCHIHSRDEKIVKHKRKLEWYTKIKNSLRLGENIYEFFLTSDIHEQHLKWKLHSANSALKDVHFNTKKIYTMLKIIRHNFLLKAVMVLNRYIAVLVALIIRFLSKLVSSRIFQCLNP